MARRVELALAWGGAVWAVSFFIGMVPLAHWIPLPSPHDSALQVADMYRGRTDEIRAGLAIMFTGVIGFIFYASALASQCRRVKGAPASLRYVQVGSLGAMITFIILPIIIFIVAAFRPERSPEATQTLNDLGWISLIIAFVPFVAWVWAVGLTIFCDESEEPVFPRWAGYLCLFLGTMQIPPVMLIFFKTGPFAWNGLMSWWLPATDFFTFVIVTLILTVRAINAEHRDAGAHASVGAAASSPRPVPAA